MPRRTQYQVVPKSSRTHNYLGTQSCQTSLRPTFQHSRIPAEWRRTEASPICIRPHVAQKNERLQKGAYKKMIINRYT